MVISLFHLSLNEPTMVTVVPADTRAYILSISSLARAIHPESNRLFSPCPCISIKSPILSDGRSHFSGFAQPGLIFVVRVVNALPYNTVLLLLIHNFVDTFRGSIIALGFLFQSSSSKIDFVLFF